MRYVRVVHKKHSARDAVGAVGTTFLTLACFIILPPGTPPSSLSTSYSDRVYTVNTRGLKLG